MILTLKLVVFLLLFSLVTINPGEAQTQFNPKIGVETWSIKDEMDMEGQSAHSGQMIGFDMYILHNRLLFAPGFHYHRISILNREEGLNFRLVEKNGSHYFTIPMTFGLQALDFPMIDAYIMGGGEVSFFYSLDSNDIDLDDDMLHGVFMSLTGVAQVELFSILTIDLKYHHALHPIIKQRPESKLRGWTLAAGIKF